MVLFEKQRQAFAEGPRTCPRSLSGCLTILQDPFSSKINPR